jgi:hypothetical protein
LMVHRPSDLESSDPVVPAAPTAVRCLRLRGADATEDGTSPIRDVTNMAGPVVHRPGVREPMDRAERSAREARKSPRGHGGRVSEGSRLQSARVSIEGNRMGDGMAGLW